MKNNNDFSVETMISDKFCVKALLWLGPDDMKWVVSQVVQGPNEHGQYVCRRIRDGFLGVTTRVKNLSQTDKNKLVEHWGFSVEK